MKYRVLISTSVEKQIHSLPDYIRERVFETLQSLGKNPRPVGSKKLKGRSGLRIRVGDYRIIYDVNDKESCIALLRVGHRRDLYR